MVAMSSLPRVSPQSVGVEPGFIRSFYAALERSGQELHSFMIVKDGAIVEEQWWNPYRPDEVHLLYSLSKSFTSTAVGFAIAEGLLSLDDPIINFLPDDLPETVSDNLARVRVRHLLSMSVGHEQDSVEFLGASKDGNWSRAFLARPVPREPGTHFVYNSGATYMLSVLIESLTGAGLLDYLRQRLFDPVGIGEVTTDRCPRGHAVGGWGMSMTTESIARFGLLLQQKGVWAGKRILPDGWVELATSKHVSNGNPAEPNDWTQGYGFQYWRCQHGVFRGDGAFGQNCVVADDLGLVLVTTGKVEDLQAVLSLFWTHFVLPLRHEAAFESPGPIGAASSPRARSMSYRTVGAEAGIDALTFDFSDVPNLTIHHKGAVDRLEIGFDGWRDGATSLLGSDAKPVSVRGAWTSEDTLVLRVRYRTSPAFTDYTFRFDGDRVEVAAEYRGRLWFDGPAGFVAIAE